MQTLFRLLPTRTRLKLTAALCLALVILLVLPAFSATAQGDPPAAETPAPVPAPVTLLTSYRLNLRAEPTRQALVLGVVPSGVSLTATAISPDLAWAAVTFNGQAGWLWLPLIRVTGGSLGALPVAEVVPGQVGDLLVGSTIADTIEVLHRRRDYQIVLSAGQTISVNMTRTSGDLDPVLYILDTLGNVVASDDDSGEGRNAFIMAFTAPEDGVYVIRATRYAGNYIQYIQPPTAPDAQPTYIPANTFGDFVLTVSGG